MNSPLTIDLSGRKGASLIIRYECANAPFALYITDEMENEMFYYRMYDKPVLNLNLPVHSDRIKIHHYGAPKVETVITQPLQLPKLKYVFNEKLIVKRNYPFRAIGYRRVRGLPFGSPARFLYDQGIIENDIDVMAGYPQPTRAFVNIHETGHYFYGRPVPKKYPESMRAHYMKQMEEDECEADRFALYHYLNQGYNFSTAFNSLADFLSPIGINGVRMAKMFQEIKKIHNNIN